MMGPSLENNLTSQPDVLDSPEDKSAEKKLELPDDSGKPIYNNELPDDSGENMPVASLDRPVPFSEESSHDGVEHSAKSTSLEQKNPRQEVVDGVTCYYDDHGRNYRKGNDLVPNNEYELNGYKYITDALARVILATGKLHLKDRDGRLQIKDSIEDIGKGDEKEGDDRGHLIGDKFDGSNGLENMIPQDANINRNDFKNFENELAREVKSGSTVFVKIEPQYSGDSRRPTEIVVTYTIDGEESVRVFPNDQEA